MGIGRWLSAALEDPLVCEEMKSDIRAWFAVGEPPFGVLRDLVEGLEATTWSSWQATYRFWTALENARRFLDENELP